MAIQTETVVINGTEYKHTWSSEGYVLRRNDGKLFVETYDQLNTSFTYTETTEKAKQSLMARLTALETSHTNLTNRHNELEALPHIVETGTSADGLSWYKLYSDNCCEQGFHIKLTNTAKLTFLKTYNNTNYTIIVSPYGIPTNATTDTNWLAFPLAKSNDGCTIRLIDSDSAAAREGYCDIIVNGSI